MCGIAGYLGPSTEAHVQRVAYMAQAIAHRGPDDSGTWSDGRVVLAHRRLSVIDISSAGHQPMISECGRYVLTYNGEIYNYIELRRELQSLGFRFRSNSDSEVLLAAFAAWGEHCVSRFNGMWAFAVWDRQAEHLFVSRDRFGEKPFYYVLQGGDFWFASEIKALLAVGVAERTVNPRMLADFASDRVSDHTDETFFRNVRQLPPGTNGWVRQGSLTVRQYWTLPPDDGEPAPHDLAEEVGALLEDAVCLRLRSDIDVGVLLSGGLDSSSVTCIAARQTGNAIAAFSTIDHQPPEEAAGIDHVIAAHPRLKLYRDTPGDDCVDAELAACLWHQEEPFADGSMLAHFRLMRLARQSGIRVLLTGQAADEVFAGYPGFQSLHLGGLLRRGAFVRALQFYRELRSSGQPVSHGSVLGYALPTYLSGRIRKRKSDLGTDWLAPGWSEGSRDISTGYSQSHPDPVNAALRACLSARTVPGFLHYEDRNSMAFGVETRIPFLDHRLVERVLPLPAETKLAGGRTKAILRNAVAGKVPKSITSRLAKQGYPAPLARWLRATSQVGREERLERVAACPLIAQSAWRRRHHRFIAGDDRELPAVWRGLVISSWHARFIMDQA